MDKSRVVIKFGGADLATSERIRKAAAMVVESPYQQVVVVVSAMSGTTSDLIGIISRIGDVCDRDYAEIVSMGERISARVFCTVLKSLGASSVYLDPTQDNWPIITDSHFLDAKPNMEQTEMLATKHVEPILGKVIPVICGFVGRDEHGNTTTLGRGGSDTTALLLANCLKADEVILVKDTKGIHSADPKLVPDARSLDLVDIQEMFALTFGGAGVIRSDALKYKLPHQKLRVVSFSSNRLDKGGTEITGVFNSNSAETCKFGNLLAISVVCDINSKNLISLLSMLQGKPIYGVCTGTRSITVFTSLQNLKETLNKLHGVGSFRAVSHRNKIGLIKFTNPAFVDSPGWIAKISGALASEKINIIEITTGKATINVFIDEEKLEDALGVVGGVFEA